MNSISKLIYANIHDVLPSSFNPREDWAVKSEDMQRILKEKRF